MRSPPLHSSRGGEGEAFSRYGESNTSGRAVIDDAKTHRNFGGPQFELVLRDKFGEISTVGAGQRFDDCGRGVREIQSRLFCSPLSLSLSLDTSIDRETFTFDE